MVLFNLSLNEAGGCDDAEEEEPELEVDGGSDSEPELELEAEADGEAEELLLSVKRGPLTWTRRMRPEFRRESASLMRSLALPCIYRTRQ